MIRRPLRIFLFLLYVSLSLGLTIFHLYVVDFPNVRSQVGVHASIVHGTAPQPYNTRILQPLVVASFLDFASAMKVRPTLELFVYAYAAIRFLSLLATFIFFDLLCAFYAGPLIGLLAGLLLASLYPLSFLFYFYQPTSLLELAFFAGSIYLIVTRRKFLYLTLIVLLAAMNRSTSIFIVWFFLLWELSRPPEERSAAGARFFMRPAALFLIWLAAYALVNRLFPGQGWVHTPLWHARYNLSTTRVWVVSLLVAWPIFAAVAYAWEEVPSRYRIMLAWLLPYIVLHFLMARCDEVRWWLPAYVVFVPYLTRSFNKLISTDSARSPLQTGQ